MKQKRLTAWIMTAVMLLLAASTGVYAEERVVYEDDFSSDTTENYVLNGSPYTGANNLLTGWQEEGDFSLSAEVNVGQALEYTPAFGAESNIYTFRADFSPQPLDGTNASRPSDGGVYIKASDGTYYILGVRGIGSGESRQAYFVAANSVLGFNTPYNRESLTNTSLNVGASAMATGGWYTAEFSVNTDLGTISYKVTAQDAQTTYLEGTYRTNLADISMNGVGFYNTHRASYLFDNLYCAEDYVASDAHSIVYNLDGGRFVTDVMYTFTPEDLPYILPPPVKPGYQFAGWFDEYGEEQLTEIPAGTEENITVYAMWEEYIDYTEFTERNNIVDSYTDSSKTFYSGWAYHDDLTGNAFGVVKHMDAAVALAKWDDFQVEEDTKILTVEYDILNRSLGNIRNSDDARFSAGGVRLSDSSSNYYEFGLSNQLGENASGQMAYFYKGAANTWGQQNVFSSAAIKGEGIMQDEGSTKFAGDRWYHATITVNYVHNTVTYRLALASDSNRYFEYTVTDEDLPEIQSLSLVSKWWMPVYFRNLEYNCVTGEGAAVSETEDVYTVVINPGLMSFHGSTGAVICAFYGQDGTQLLDVDVRAFTTAGTASETYTFTKNKTPGAICKIFVWDGGLADMRPVWMQEF